MKKTKQSELLLPLLTAVILALGGLLLCLFPVPRFSAAENRLLADKPTFSWQALWQGEYTAAWERYTAERLTGRDALRAVHATCEIALGKKESGGVILCTDRTLAARPQPSTALLKRNLIGIAALTEACRERALPCTVAFVPCRAEGRRAVLPASYTASATKTLCEALKNQGEAPIAFESLTADSAWFHTDHHWTAAGSYAAYRQLAPLLGYEPYGEEAFEKISVSTDFLGTGARTAGLPLITPDTITLWRFADDEDYHLCTNGEKTDFNGFYDFSKLNTCDGYAVFLGGNDGLLTVTRGDGDARPTLLLVRDSYAAALIPFLARHYRIVAVDPRYYRGDIAQLPEKADQVLLLAGTVTLTESAFLR